MLVVFYASCACEVAILMRKHSEVDLFNLTFGKEDPPLSPTHPAMQVAELLALWVQDYFEQRLAAGADTSDVDDDAELKRAADLSRMHAALMWRSYIFALGANPKRWQKGRVCALGALKILSTGDSSQVITLLRAAEGAEVIRTNVRDDDWPPRTFIIYTCGTGIYWRKSCRL